MRKLVGVLILLGAIGFIVGLLQKVIYFPSIIGFVPTSYLKFSGMCLLLAIALCTRAVAFKEKVD